MRTFRFDYTRHRRLRTNALFNKVEDYVTGLKSSLGERAGKMIFTTEEAARYTADLMHRSPSIILPGSVVITVPSPHVYEVTFTVTPLTVR